MALDNNIMDELGSARAPKSKRTKQVLKAVVKKVETAPEKPATPKKEENLLFTLVIVAVVILGIIGIVFGYTKDKLKEMKTGGNDVTKQLEQQVAELKQQLTTVTEKTDNLEKDNLNNKEIVLDLYEKSRKLPTEVVITDWTPITDEKLGFTMSYPATWEAVAPVAPAPVAEGEKVESVQMIYLQPIGVAEFANAITVKSDYADFAKMSLQDKLEVFQDLELIDSVSIKGGEMLYFLNADKDNNIVPTILILTKDNIYRATFNITNKKVSNYFEYRKNFEEIVRTFAVGEVKK